MKIILCLFIAVLSISTGTAQTRTINSPGLWNNTGIWTGGNIADVITEDVTINNNIGLVTVSTDYTIGNIAMNNGNTLTINTGVTMNVGQSGTPKNLSSGNTGTVNISGTLIIWGDLNVGNNLDLNVVAGGILIIKGNVNMGTGGDLVISGSVQIDGNFVGGNDTDLIVNGTVNIGGNITVGNNSDPSGTGTVTVGGSCTDGASNFCGNGPLPIKLISFSATRLENSISIKWVTTMEKNFDYFQLERASTDLDFSLLNQIEGRGGSDVTTTYTYTDNLPKQGKNYYRLKSVDLDGSFEYSRVIVAEWSSVQHGISIYPNPITSRSFTIELNDMVTSPVVLNLCEVRGLSVFQTEINSNSVSVTLPDNISAGVYLIKLSLNSGIRTIRVILN